MEATECIVYFSRFDENLHRPRSLPCGHTECTECIENAIEIMSKECPKCRAIYAASNVNDLPVNFSLEGIIKVLNVSKKNEGNELSDCNEHQLPLISRCSTQIVGMPELSECHLCTF